MARNHFALERPRKINIAIPGYDADAATRLQGRAQSEQRKRKKKREKKPDSTEKALTPDLDTIQGEVAALSASSHAPKVDQHELVQIFGGTPPGRTE